MVYNAADRKNVRVAEKQSRRAARGADSRLVADRRCPHRRPLTDACAMPHTALLSGRALNGRYELDTVIWLQPGRSALETLLHISDMGIRNIVISEVGTPDMPSRYYVWRHWAIEVLLKDWRSRHSVRRVTVVDSKYYRSAVTEELLRAILEHLEIEPIIRTFQDEDSSAFLSDLCRTETSGMILPCAALASMFAFRSPDKLADLLKTQRVALLDCPVDTPFAKLPDAPVDLVTVNWQAIAESIVNDLITREGFDRNRHTTFEAEAHLRVPLSSFCDEIRPTRSIGSPE